IPGEGGNTNVPFIGFPLFPAPVGPTYANGSVDELLNHARNYNAFFPRIAWAWDPATGRYVNNANLADDRAFPVSDLETLYRYGDTGSPALGSDLLRLSPLNFSDPRRRRMVTTHSVDFGRPGVSPWLNPDAAAPAPYLLAGPYPTGGPQGFPPLAALLPNADKQEFRADGRGHNVAAKPTRLDLNRGLTDYPTKVDPATGQIPVTTDPAAAAQYDAAVRDRQKFASDIFNRLRYIATGDRPNDPVNYPFPAPGTPNYK